MKKIKLSKSENGKFNFAKRNLILLREMENYNKEIDCMLRHPNEVEKEKKIYLKIHFTQQSQITPKKLIIIMHNSMNKFPKLNLI